MIRFTLIGVALLTLSACATYQTPGAGVNIGNLSKADEDIFEVMKREPAASFPVRLAVARVQSPGYYTRNAHCYGKGQYCLVTAREVEKDQDFERITRLPMVSPACGKCNTRKSAREKVECIWRPIRLIE